MTFTEQQVEWIVMEVIRRLEVAADATRATAQNRGELRVNDRVVTLRSIEGRLAGVTRLLVQPRAIVTPAVKDELKQRKIELVMADKT